MPSPRYTHACPRCTFVGVYQHFDLYTCPTSLGFSCIARSGDEPSEYASAPSFVLDKNHEVSGTLDRQALTVCYKLAKETP